MISDSEDDATPTMDPPQFASWGGVGVAYLDVDSVATIIPWERASYPYNPRRVFEMRFFAHL